MIVIVEGNLADVWCREKEGLPYLSSVFTFEELNNLPTGVSKILKKCALAHLSSKKVMTEATNSKQERKPN